MRKITHATSLKPLAIAARIIIALLMLTATMPSTAYGNETATLFEEIRTLREELEESQNTYIQLTSDAANAEAQKKHAEDELEKIKQELQETQTRLSSIVTSEYTSFLSNDTITAIAVSQNMDDIMQAISYSGKMKNDMMLLTEKTQTLKQDTEQKISELEELTEDYQNKAKQEEEHGEEFKSEISKAQERLSELNGQINQELLTLDKRTQYEQNIEFLENAGMITDRQRSIIKAAYETSYSGPSLCEAWVERVLRNSVDENYPRYYSAYTNYKENCDNFSIETAQPGDLIYSSGTTSLYGHIGIIVSSISGDSTLIMDNEGANRGEAVPYSEWIKYATGVNIYTSSSGFWGTHTV